MLSLTRKVAAAVLGAAALVTGTVLAAPTSATAATPTYAFFYTKLPNGKNVVQRWNPCQNITYKVNVAAVPSKYRTYALSTTQQAMAKITAVNGLKFTYKGQTTEVPRRGTNKAKQSAEIIIAWTTPSKTDFPLYGQTAGYGGHMNYWWGTSANGRVTYQAASTRGYLVLDSPQMFAQMRRGFGAGSTQGNIILHELGHVIGLNHVSTPSQVMYGTISSRTPNGYAWGDRAGLVKLGKSAGCINVPAYVTPDLK